jgi:hypothetical protein
MSNSTETSPLHYQWSPWKRLNGKYPVVTDRSPLPDRNAIYVPDDWLDPEVPVDWLVSFLALIHYSPEITWLLSTFRPGDWLSRVDAKALLKLEMEKDRETLALREWLRAWIEGTPPSNVWVGSPIFSQEQADSLIPKLLAIPAVGRFLLCDPLLGPVEFTHQTMFGSACVLDEPIQRNVGRTKTGNVKKGIHWVSIGGETGPNACPCNIDWIRSLVRQCKDAAVPVMVERLGAVPVYTAAGGFTGEEANKAIRAHWDDPNWMIPWNSPHNLSPRITHPDGEDPSEWPHDIRIREIPEGLR